MLLLVERIANHDMLEDPREMGLHVIISGKNRKQSY